MSIAEIKRVLELEAKVAVHEQRLADMETAMRNLGAVCTELEVRLEGMAQRAKPALAGR